VGMQLCGTQGIHTHIYCGRLHVYGSSITWKYIYVVTWDLTKHQRHSTTYFSLAYQCGGSDHNHMA
jgi:hypothetical protein